MKKCKVCLTEKDDSKFYKHHVNCCKDCYKARQLAFHRAKFKYNSAVYQIVCYRAGLKTAEWVNSASWGQVIRQIWMDDEFNTDWMDSVGKRLVQRTRLVGEELELFKEELERTIKVIKNER